MQDYLLSNPGDSQLLQTLRRIVSKAIADANQDTNASSALGEFLAEAASKCPGYTGGAPGEGVISVGSPIRIGSEYAGDLTTPGTIRLVDGELRATFDEMGVGWASNFTPIPVYTLPDFFNPIERLYGEVELHFERGRVTKASGDLTMPPEE